MTEPLPEPPPAVTDGQREQTAQEIADALIAAVNKALPETPWRHDVTPPQGGSPPPVAQPGTPPMTPRETQIGRVALYSGAGVSLPILSGAVFMVATEHANPDVIAWCAVGITALAALAAAVGYAIKRLVAAAPPPEVHNHIDGDLYQDQRNIHSRTSGVWAKSINEQ
ncbi:hypothetical protein [Streptomyces sp. NPDC058268]|uniref:hypothetical protein n=1 Tax=Streptomyces sp. NPDC058268 TaxID=3346413 RepID=UPI0036E4B33D